MLLLNPLNDLRRYWDWQNDEQMLRLWIRSATHGNGGRQLGESMRTDDARYGGLRGSGAERQSDERLNYILTLKCANGIMQRLLLSASSTAYDSMTTAIAKKIVALFMRWV